jgi:hypothetical protein
VARGLLKIIKRPINIVDLIEEFGSACDFALLNATIPVILQGESVPCHWIFIKFGN